jgi:hypothetical protein
MFDCWQSWHWQAVAGTCLTAVQEDSWTPHYWCRNKALTVAMAGDCLTLGAAISTGMLWLVPVGLLEEQRHWSAVADIGMTGGTVAGKLYLVP